MPRVHSVAERPCLFLVVALLLLCARASASWNEIVNPYGSTASRWGSSMWVDAVGKYAVVGASGDGLVSVVDVSGASPQLLYTVNSAGALGNSKTTDKFGISVAMSSDGLTWVGGASLYGGANGGAIVYMHAANPSTFASRTALLPCTGAAGQQGCGYTVAISGNGLQIAVASDSSLSTVAYTYAYVYRRLSTASTTWTMSRSISNMDWVEVPTQPHADLFGYALAFDDAASTLVVGAPNTDASVSLPNAGCIYIYTISGAVVAKSYLDCAIIYPTQFGFAVALSGNGLSLWVSAPLENNVYVDEGLVYQYAFASTWTYKTSYTIASAAATNGRTGFHLTLSQDGSRILIGAPGASTTGAVVSCDSSLATMSCYAPFNGAPDVAGAASYGYSVAMSSSASVAIIASKGLSPFPGQAFVYRPVQPLAAPSSPPTATGSRTPTPSLTASLSLSSSISSAVTASTAPSGSASVTPLGTSSGTATAAPTSSTAATASVSVLPSPSTTAAASATPAATTSPSAVGSGTPAATTSFSASPVPSLSPSSTPAATATSSTPESGSAAASASPLSTTSLSASSAPALSPSPSPNTPATTASLSATGSTLVAASSSPSQTRSVGASVASTPSTTSAFSGSPAATSSPSEAPTALPSPSSLVTGSGTAVLTLSRSSSGGASASGTPTAAAAAASLPATRSVATTPSGALSAAQSVSSTPSTNAAASSSSASASFGSSPSPAQSAPLSLSPSPSVARSASSPVSPPISSTATATNAATPSFSSTPGGALISTSSSSSVVPPSPASRSRSISSTSSAQPFSGSNSQAPTTALPATPSASQETSADATGSPSASGSSSASPPPSTDAGSAIAALPDDATSASGTGVGAAAAALVVLAAVACCALRCRARSKGVADATRTVRRVVAADRALRFLVALPDAPAAAADAAPPELFAHLFDSAVLSAADASASAEAVGDKVAERLRRLGRADFAPVVVGGGDSAPPLGTTKAPAAAASGESSKSAAAVDLLPADALPLFVGDVLKAADRASRRMLLAAATATAAAAVSQPQQKPSPSPASPPPAMGGKARSKKGFGPTIMSSTASSNAATPQAEAFSSPSSSSSSSLPPSSNNDGNGLEMKTFSNPIADKKIKQGVPAAAAAVSASPVAAPAVTAATSSAFIEAVLEELRWEAAVSIHAEEGVGDAAVVAAPSLGEDDPGGGRKERGATASFSLSTASGITRVAAAGSLKALVARKSDVTTMHPKVCASLLTASRKMMVSLVGDTLGVAGRIVAEALVERLTPEDAETISVAGEHCAENWTSNSAAVRTAVKAVSAAAASASGGWLAFLPCGGSGGGGVRARPLHHSFAPPPRRGDKKQRRPLAATFLELRGKRAARTNAPAAAAAAATSPVAETTGGAIAASPVDLVRLMRKCVAAGGSADDALVPAGKSIEKSAAVIRKVPRRLNATEAPKGAVAVRLDAASLPLNVERSAVIISSNADDRSATAFLNPLTVRRATSKREAGNKSNRPPGAHL